MCGAVMAALAVLLVVVSPIVACFPKVLEGLVVFLMVAFVLGVLERRVVFLMVVLVREASEHLTAMDLAKYLNWMDE